MLINSFVYDGGLDFRARDSGLEKDGRIFLMLKHN
jgi:hypothetical protein